ncbi:MAG: L-aspartate oxidase [Verrucomicrobia subdivision 6 bacterium BACL9 MAG-120820-bin42]|uniref:L-aspartate oxidase n=2 Tax=Verrucomicrobia subdivision 6 TaxID=134627 RepID=A0A0R2XAD9_9BACT|nr:MAG: L-aspartate oxidase [Verrucomicrobia subdivision 6 bacterium BACL9 MAG-120507-bin52]KRP33066.1 MAG: L-aspartate oxidase [Verrucomicrobia subdivision 6 bacterium BACL9 MAG-120820-bin42]
MANRPSQDFSAEVIVIGSGIAGLSFALKAARHAKVLLLTKKNAAESNTNYAQGGIACVTSAEDSAELHIRDTVGAGAGLCREEVVRDVVQDGPARVAELVELGVKFTERKNGVGHEPDLGKEAGHSKRRVLHAGDITGRELEKALLAGVRASPQIRVREDIVAIDLVTTKKRKLPGPNRVLGLYVLDGGTQRVEAIRAQVVVLATGGCGKCYLYTTNPGIATGDGVAMAYRAGVAIANMEFVQFHPTCLFHPSAPSFLISEALRGEGGVVVNAKGEDFTKKTDPRGSLAPRDIVARAIDEEMKESGAACVYLDIRAKGAEFLEKRFPAITATLRGLGIDPALQPIPVVPAAHYQCGGVPADLAGKTELTGLWALGEVACTGLHGANRLASNSLLEALVMAHRAAESLPTVLAKMARVVSIPAWKEGKAHDADEMVVITHNWKEIRQLMWDYVGIARTKKRLLRAQSRLRLLLQEVEEFYWNFRVTGDLLELRNLALCASLIVESALQRKESRGLHAIADYPKLQRVPKDTVIRPKKVG